KRHDRPKRMAGAQVADVGGSCSMPPRARSMPPRCRLVRFAEKRRKVDRVAGPMHSEVPASAAVEESLTESAAVPRIDPGPERPLTVNRWLMAPDHVFRRDDDLSSRRVQVGVAGTTGAMHPVRQRSMGRTRATPRAGEDRRADAPN